MLGDVCQQRRTTAVRLLAALADCPGLTGRRLLVAVLTDVAQGADSALERRYLRHVERVHALSPGSRQVRVVHGGSSAYRDVLYRSQHVVVELDGRLGHDGTSDRWDDLRRDLASAHDGVLTVRVGWRQVLEPCRLAGDLAALLRTRGWSGTSRPCGLACPRR